MVPADNINRKSSAVISMGLVIAIGVGVYFNSLNGAFLWDDEELVKGNAYTKTFSHVVHILAKGAVPVSIEKFPFYRPLQMLTYTADYSLWKLDVRGYHLTNVILHILVALCILWLVFLLFGDPLLAFLTAAFFVAHPIHTEAVSYISGRADPLAALFMLLTFIFYIKDLTVPMALSYILALLSRESSLILPVLLLFYHYLPGQSREGGTLPTQPTGRGCTFKGRLDKNSILTFGSITIMYTIARFVLFRNLLPHAQTTAFERLPGFFVALTTYVRLLILPFSLHMEYGNRTFPLLDPQAISGIVIFCFLVFFLIRMRRSSLTTFSLGFFLIALLPSSNLYPLNAYMAEHWLYLPSIGFFLILAKGVRSLYAKKSLEGIAISLVLILISFYSSLTILQNRYWREPIPFYERTLAFAPESTTVHNNLGILYSEAGRHGESIAAFKRAITADPKYADAYYNLGKAYGSQRRYYESLGAYLKVIALRPSFARAHNALGVIYIAMGKFEEARAAIEKAVDIDPRDAMAHNDLGIAYGALGKYDKAIAAYEKAIALNPRDPRTHNNLGILYTAIGRNGDAVASFKNAVETDPHFGEGYYNLAVLYFQEKQYPLACDCCDKARMCGYTNRELIEALMPYRSARASQ